MKNLIITLIAFLSVGMMWANDTDIADRTMEVLNSESSVHWQAYKVGGNHEGFVDIKSGALEFDAEGKLTGGHFIMDMTTISCTDLSGSSNEKLVGHLKSDDFFDVANHPEARLDIKRVISRGLPGDYRIVADLTIKDITHEIRFNTLLEEKGSMKVGSVDLVIDRSKYNVRYGSGTFFSNLGDNTIYDEFDISVNIAVK
nr:YceI family protein [Saprospiraceae bacterium]